MENMENIAPEMPSAEPTIDADISQTTEVEADDFNWDNIKSREVEIEVEGKKQKVPLEQLRKDYQYRTAADRRFEQAAQMRQEVEAAIGEFNRNPVEGLKKLNATAYFQENPSALIDLVGPENFKKFAEETLWQQIQRERMLQENPDKVYAEEYKRKLEEYENREKSEKERREKEAADAKEAEDMERVRTDIEAKIHSALSASSLPPTPETVGRYARFYGAALRMGYEPDPADIVAKVEESYMNEYKNLMSKLPEEKLAAFFGDDIMKKMRKQDLGKLKEPNRPVVGGDKGYMKDPKTYIDPDEFFAQKRKSLGL